MIQEPRPNAYTRSFSRRFRSLEIVAIFTFFLLMFGLVGRLWGSIFGSPWLVLSAVLLAYLAADLVSGVVHWAGDSWGTPEWPLFGSSLIRPFREHHVDQTAITRHDFVETNGSNCLISIPVALAALLIPFDDEESLSIFSVAFLGSLILWVFATNQFHKWAHLANPPPFVNWLQKLHLILPPAHHAIHHCPPFNRYYCITVGWLNWPLTKIGFFPFLERVVSALSGAVPRQDDLGEQAALALVALQCEREPSPQKAHLPALH
jgi:plasmanylethanolamine desaturase